MLGVARLPLRQLIFMGETNAENSKKIAIGGLHIRRGLNQSLPLLHHGTQLISRQIHSMEIRQNVPSYT